MTSKTLSPKEQRMAKAAKLRYMKGMKTREIASEVGVKPQTVRTYFSEDSMERFKRKFSDMEKFKLQRLIEQDLSDAESIAKEALGQAKRQAEDSSDYRQIAEAALKIRQRKVDLLQELGIIDKQPDKEIHEEKGGGDKVVERMQQAYQELQEQDQKEKVEAEN
jgi:DNA-binding transcriptional regulator LsrR (DeoR family)